MGMAVTIDRSSVRVTPRFTDAVPAIRLGRNGVLSHCTKNANLVAADDLSARTTFGNAMTWTGRVTVTGDETEIRTKWTFGFVQLCDEFVNESVFGGRISGEGSMRANYKLGHTANPAIDADAKTSTLPFSDSVVNIKKKPGTASAFEVVCDDGDNPTAIEVLTATNRRTHSPNFLFSARRDDGFVTVFAAKEEAPDGATFHFFAHFTWHLLWHAELRWTSALSPPRLLVRDARLDHGSVTMGGPTDQRFTALLANPVGPTINDQDDQAHLDAWDGRREPVLQQLQGRLPEIPSDFFTLRPPQAPGPDPFVDPPGLKP
jgi:hypothetical protein